MLRTASFSRAPVALLSVGVFALLHGSVLTQAALDQDGLERALHLARAPARDRARFHAPYVFTFDGPDLEELQVVTEFRRAVLIAEDHLRIGDWMFTRSPAQASAALEPWRGLVVVTARLRFNPLNVYATMPPYTMTLQSAAGTVRPVATSVTSILAPQASSDAGGQVILGALVECRFEEAAVTRERREVRIVLGDVIVAAATVDFGAFE